MSPSCSAAAAVLPAGFFDDGADMQLRQFFSFFFLECMYRCTICHTIAHAMPTHDATRAAAGQNERRLQPATAARARLKTASSLQRVVIVRAFGVFCLKQSHSCTSELMPPPCLHTCTRRAKRAAVALNCRTATRASHAVCVWGGHASSTGRERGSEREREGKARL